MIKLISCDIDGTLLKKGETRLRKEVADALTRLFDEGRHIALASGRSYYSMRKVAESLPFADDVYYICAHGALCIYRGKVLYQKQMSIENVLKFARAPIYEGDPIVYYSDKFSYVLAGNTEFLAKLERENVDRIVPIENVYEIKEPIYRIGVYGTEKKPPALTPLPFDIRVCYNEDNWIEYITRYADKGAALSDLQMRLYLSKLDTAALGDGENDLGMFDKAKYTFAARDGDKALCEKAGEVFDNVAEALEEIRNSQCAIRN